MTTTKAVIPTTTSNDSPSTYESTYVHTVYDNIAHHFSSTRYKPWPVVAAFLASIPLGYIGLDAGCGNGKYLIAPEEREGRYWTVGLDRSAGLLEFAKRAGGRDRECVLGDVLDVPWRAGAFDFAISIATIHHLSTPERRNKSIQSLLRCLSPSHGRGLIYVWSIRQDDLSKRSVPKENIDLNHRGQDVFVPWVLSENSKSDKRVSPDGTSNDSRAKRDPGPVFNRYYHLFDEGELRELIVAAAAELGISIGSRNGKTDTLQCLDDVSLKPYIEILKDDWEKSNHYIEFQLFQRQ